MQDGNLYYSTIKCYKESIQIMSIHPSNLILIIILILKFKYSNLIYSSIAYNYLIFREEFGLVHYC